jgi:hypothetical protein
LVMLASHAPKVGDEVKAQVGRQSALRGVVRWRTELDKDVVKIGIEYLE